MLILGFPFRRQERELFPPWYAAHSFPSRVVAHAYADQHSAKDLLGYDSWLLAGLPINIRQSKK